MSYSVEAVTGDIAFGEGPHWSWPEGVLYFVDIFEQYVRRHDPSMGLDTKLHIEGGFIPIAVPHAHEPNTFIVAIGRSLAAVTWPDPTQDHNVTPSDYQVLGSVEEDRPANRFNDGKCDAAGRLWAGTMGDTQLPDNANPYQGGMYRLGMDQSITQVIDKVSQSNGLCWSGDNRTFYHIDTVEYQVYAYDYDIDTAAISNKRVAFDFRTLGLPDTTGPDGMTIDTQDNLWIAGYATGKVFCVDPSTGQVVTEVELPVPNVTSVCWGGPDLADLYVTTGGAPVYRVTGLGVKGRPAPGCDVDLPTFKSS